MQILSKAKKIFSQSVDDKIAKEYGKRIGVETVAQNKDFLLVQYIKNGKFDYDTYRSIQELGNKEKINKVFADEACINAVANYAKDKIHDIRFVLCHGTRNGAELRWFGAALGPRVKVVGTDISETATQFPNTIQWDFHDVKSEWAGKVDLLYSNSWDHSYDPQKLFTAWISCLAPGGIMCVEYTVKHDTGKATLLDPFGIHREALVAMLNEIGNGLGTVTEIVEHPAAKYGIRSFIMFTRE